jgi:hypothetical protein
MQMTALRNFPNAPLARQTSLPHGAWVPGFALKFWRALYRYGQRRAARELDLLADRRALAAPLQARQLRAAAAECRQQAKYSPTNQRSS